MEWEMGTIDGLRYLCVYNQVASNRWDWEFELEGDAAHGYLALQSMCPTLEIAQSEVMVALRLTMKLH